MPRGMQVCAYMCVYVRNAISPAMALAPAQHNEVIVVIPFINQVTGVPNWMDWIMSVYLCTRSFSLQGVYDLW